MNRKSSKAPLLEPPDAANSTPETRSAAHDALQNNLDKNATLKKKNSWLNIGGNIRKGAMAVKGAFGYGRGDSATLDEPEVSPIETASRPTPSEQANSESTNETARPTTPPKPVQRHNTFSPKAMATSFRHAFPRQHSQRSSVSRSTYCNLNDEHGSPRGPEQILTGGQDDVPQTTHRRRTSLAGTLVGSIRNRRFSRATSLKKLAPCNLDDLPALPPSPTKPIDIPSTAPHLSLNLSPLGTMSPPFGEDLRRDSKADALDLKQITSGLPDDRGICVPPELETSVKAREYLNALKSPSSELTLQLPPPAMEGGWFNPELSRNVPTTPMPGTNLSLELDGNVSEKSAVFERSVEPPGSSVKKSGHSLRQMRSLDAFARRAHHPAAPPNSTNDSLEALATAAEVAHSADEIEQHWTHGTMDALDVASENAADMFDESCTSPTIIEVECEWIQEMDDVSMSLDGTPTMDLIPAPLDIPQRLRPHRDLLSATTVQTCPPDMVELHPCMAPTRRDSTYPAGSSPDTHGQEFARSDQPHHDKGKAPAVDEHTHFLFGNPGSHDNAAAAEEDEQIIDQLHSSSQADDAESIITDYDEFKTQLFFPTDDANSIDLPNYDYADEVSGSPPNVTPLVPVLARAVNSSQESSPASGRVSGIRSADVGGLMYKFTIGNWLGHTSDSEAGEPSTPTAQRVAESLDGGSEATEVGFSLGDPFTEPAGNPPSPSSQPDEDAKYRFHAAVPTSSPACLTEWEKQNFQTSVPAQAHELACGPSVAKSSPLPSGRKERISSNDTLEDTLALFRENEVAVLSSPLSGYEGDESGAASSDGTPPQPKTARFHFRGFVGGME